MVSSAGRGLSSREVRPHFLQCKYKFSQNNSTVTLSKISKHEGLTMLHLLCFKTNHLTGEGTHREKQRCWQWCTASCKDLCYCYPRREPCFSFSHFLLFWCFYLENLLSLTLKYIHRSLLSKKGLGKGIWEFQRNNRKGVFWNTSFENI